MNTPSKTLATATFNKSIQSYLFWYGTLILLISVIGIPLILPWILGLGQSYCKKYYKKLECKLRTQHLEFKKGHIFRVEKTIPLDNIQDLTFIDNPLLRIFDLRILKIETAGNSGQNSADMKLIGIIDAGGFKSQIIEQREKLKSNNNLENTDNQKENTLEILKEIRDLLSQLAKNKS